jgi:hypothetical protein
MGQIDQLHVQLCGRNRAELAEPFRASWFDHFMHCISTIDALVHWRTQHNNELENQQHFCVSVSSEGNARHMAMLMDEMVQMMPHDMLRHTLHGCYVLPYMYPYEDRSMPYDMNPVMREGWQLVLPNINTDEIANVMHELPTTRRTYADC